MIQENMPLSTLPAELVSQIASHLDLATFRSFRLVSSHLHTNTFHSFKTRFFTTQQLSWTKPSLSRLVQISQHSELSHAHHHLIINATPHYSLSLWKMRRRCSEAGHLTPTPVEDGQALITRLNREYIDLAVEAEEVGKCFTETWFDVKCLTTAFSNLKNLESITFAYEGMDFQYSKFGRTYCEASQLEMSRPFVSTMAALAASGQRVKYISLQCGQDYGAVSIGRLESLAPSFRGLDAAFAELHTLQLRLRDWRSPDSGFALEETRAPFLVRFLAKCSSVRVLEIDCCSALEDDLFGRMARTCQFEKLERCTLSMFRISRAEDLLKFLTPSSSCLLYLALDQILLDDDETTWAQLLSEMADSKTCLQALEAIELRWLFTQQGSKLVFRDMDRTVRSATLGLHWRDGLKSGKYGSTGSCLGPTWESGAYAYPFLLSQT